MALIDKLMRKLKINFEFMGSGIPTKRILLLLLLTCVMLSACGTEKNADKPIVGEWKCVTTDNLTLYYSFEDDGDFNSYAELEGFGVVPGGTGTYICKDGMVEITMSTGSTTESEYEISGDELKLNGLFWVRVS